jgi:flagellar basal body-associated protein FliL
MKELNKNKETKKKSRSIFAAITGAIVGSGVAVAGAIFMKDKKNQAKVKKVLSKAKDKAVGYFEKIEEVKKDKTPIEKKKISTKKIVKNKISQKPIL